MTLACKRRDAGNPITLGFGKLFEQTAAELIVRHRVADFIAIYPGILGDLAQHIYVADVAALSPQRFEDRFIESEPPIKMLAFDIKRGNLCIQRVNIRHFVKREHFVGIVLLPQSLDVLSDLFEVVFVLPIIN